MDPINASPSTAGAAVDPVVRVALVPAVLSMHIRLAWLVDMVLQHLLCSYILDLL